MVNGNERLVEMGPFGIFLAFVLFAWMFFSQVLNYVFHATAFSQIMQIKKISRPFLAWLPIGGNYSLGKICDSINNKNNKKSNFKILLTIFSSCLLATYALCVIIYKASAASGGNQVPSNKVLTFLLLAFFVICTVFYIISLNCVFKEFCPNNSKYFALSLISTIFPILPFVSGIMLLKAAKGAENLSSKP